MTRADAATAARMAVSSANDTMLSDQEDGGRGDRHGDDRYPCAP